MADTSLFSRLQRLFSSDVIIRNVGGKRLKVMDTARIQKYGNLATNSLYDRFTRLHKPVGSSLQYNPTLNYQSMRLQLYSDYEAMDHDPIIAAALDIISDETTSRNEYGDVLNINSSDENIRKVLHNLNTNYGEYFESWSNHTTDTNGDGVANNIFVEYNPDTECNCTVDIMVSYEIYDEDIDMFMDYKSEDHEINIFH